MVEKLPRWGVFREILETMSDKTHKTLTKLRTFQIDQAHARGEEPVVVPKIIQSKNNPVPAVAPKIVIKNNKAFSSVTETPAPSPLLVTPPVPPSFHELKKSAHSKIEHIVSKEAKPVSKTVTVRKNEPALLRRSFSSTATVITSNKKNEFKFFSAVGAALKDWVTGLNTKNKTPKYTVNATERRKGVIQKATTSSGAVFTTDIDTLKKEITRKREQVLDEAPHPTHLNWSPQTEPGFPLIEGPHHLAALPAKRPVIVEYKKRSLPTPQIVEPAEKKDEIPRRVFTPLPNVDPTKETGRWGPDSALAPDSPYAPTRLETLKPPVPPPIFRIPGQVIAQPTEPAAPLYNPPPTQAYIPPTPTASTQQFEVPTLNLSKPGTSIPNKPNPRSAYLRNGMRQLFRFDTTAATVVLVGSIVSFVMVFLIVKTFLGIIAPSISVSEPVISLAEPLSPKGKVIDVAVSAVSKDAIVSALSTESRPASGVTEFRILTADGGVIAGDTLWDSFGFSSNPNLARSITEARLGYASRESVIILKVTDAVTVFGALLSWEQDMATEIRPWFENDETGTSTFTDDTVGNSDIRILKSGNEVIIVYGFIDKNTLVITESLEAYSATLGSN